jgi:hypothetical protein
MKSAGLSVTLALFLLSGEEGSVVVALLLPLLLLLRNRFMVLRGRG